MHSIHAFLLVSAVLLNGIGPAAAVAQGASDVPGDRPAKVAWTPARINSADVVVITSGKASSPFPVDLLGASPRVFMAFGTGAGQSAALSPGGILNRGSTPASAGDVLSLWVTAVRPNTDRDYDPGAVSEGVCPLVNSIRVFVGGVEAEVLYAASAPGMIGAAAQINIRIGEGTPKGPQPVLILVGEEPSTESTTLAID